MSSQAHRLIGLAVFEDGIQIAKVVRKPVGIAAPSRQAETTPVRRNHMPVARQRIDYELERRRYVHPTM
ncbi:hypothetical protein SDC9_167837 [bioreactor metagenome]|uniref:Uncharacterized protein n=1 Tax=bioreactor metagenome TaxID=1076179 RepID=A0A645G0U4_9ZZZZ